MNTLRIIILITIFIIIARYVNKKQRKIRNRRNYIIRQQQYLQNLATIPETKMHEDTSSNNIYPDIVHEID